MRKLWIIILALALSIIMLVPLALPAAAAPPNKVVAWVNWTGSNAYDVNEYGYSKSVKQIKLKLMSDGTIEGGFEIISFEGGVHKESFPVWGLHFSEQNGVKTADILTSAIDPVTGTWYLWWHLVDGGEPALLNDKWMDYVWTDFSNYPPEVPGPNPLDVNVGFPPDSNTILWPYAWPPVAVEPTSTFPYVNQGPLVWWPLPGNVPGVPGEPLRPSAPDNLQIHITDAYWDLFGDN